MNRILIGLFLILVTLPLRAAGLMGFGPTAAELPLLPDYCQAKEAGPKSPEFQAWVMKVGPKFERTWNGMHHVCSGITHINRYLRLVNDPKRGYYLSRAVPEIDYIAAHMPDDYPLAGDILMHRGHANLLMKRNAAAIADFIKSISLDPRQTRSYVHLADIYSAMDNKTKALEVITAGLKAVPTSKAMQRRYLALGGKEPFPEPDQAPAATSTTTGEQAPPTKTDAPVQPIATQQPDGGSVSGPEPGKQPEPAEKQDAGTPAVEETKVKIGTDQNPYCRFCP